MFTAARTHTRKHTTDTPHPTCPHTRPTNGTVMTCNDGNTNTLCCYWNDDDDDDGDGDGDGDDDDDDDGMI